MEKRQELIAQLGDAMQEYQRSTQAFDDAVGRELGLNPTDLRCLDWLVDGPKTAGELSVATGLRPAATTTLIDRLTEKGYVRRVPSPDDRRRVLVEMTAKGRDRTWEYYGPLVNEGQAKLTAFDDEQLILMRDFLVTIRELTDEHRKRFGEPGES